MKKITITLFALFTSIFGISQNNSCFSDNFNDGDFTNNTFWNVRNSDDIPGSISVENNDYVKFMRENASGNGGSVILTSITDISINNNTLIKFDVNPVFSDVGNGAGWTNDEYPINVWLHLKDANGTNLTLRFAYNYRGGEDLNESEYIRVAFPNCDQNEWLRDQEFNISNYFPQAVHLDSIRIGGNGWDFEGYVDNIELINCDANSDCLSDNFNDGDFTNNTFCNVRNGDDIPGSVSVENNDYVKFMRENASGNGGSVILTTITDYNINNNTSIKFDVNPVFSDVGNGAGWTNDEYPINVWLHLKDANGTNLTLRFAYNYRGGEDLNESEYIRVAFPNCDQNEWLRDQEFNISNYFPQAVHLDSIRIGGNGWDFEGYVDNIELINCNSTSKVTNNKYDQDVIIYPNPVENNFKIELKTNEVLGFSVELYDIVGKKVYMKSYKTNIANINIADIGSGTYILMIKNADGQIINTKKLVKK